jgi:hypothetical protein
MSTTYSIQQLLVKEAGRIGPEIYRRTIDTSAWLKLTKQETFPEEMGDVISSVTFERFYPSSILATAADTAVGYSTNDIRQDAGTGWRTLGSNQVSQDYQGFNPFTQAVSTAGDGLPVASSSSTGNVLPAKLSGVTFGQKLRQYSLEWASVDSPDISLEDLRFAVKRREQLSNIMDVLTESTSLVWQDRYRNLYTKAVANEGNLVYPSTVANGIVASTSTTTGDAKVVYTAVVNGVATAASGSITAANLPQSQLTQGILKRLYMKLIRDGAGTNAMGRENGAPVFMLICGAETSENLIRLNADIRQDFRYAKPNELLTPLGIERSYGGFYHAIDPYPPRFMTYNSTPQNLIRIYPFRKETTTKGTAYNINPAYETASYEISYIFHQDVYRSVVPTPMSTDNKMGFNPQNYRGEFKWVNILDRENNPDGNVGYFRGVVASGARPVFPQYGYVVLHTRPAISLDYVS